MVAYSGSFINYYFDLVQQYCFFWYILFWKLCRCHLQKTHLLVLHLSWEPWLWAPNRIIVAAPGLLVMLQQNDCLFNHILLGIIPTYIFLVELQLNPFALSTKFILWSSWMTLKWQTCDLFWTLWKTSSKVLIPHCFSVSLYNLHQCES